MRNCFHVLLLALAHHLGPCNGFESVHVESRPEGLLRPTLWDADVPGNCAARCAHRDTFMERVKDLSRVVVASVHLSKLSHPHLAHCGDPEDSGGAACAPWDGAGLYLPGSDPDRASSANRFLLVSDNIPRPLFEGGSMDDIGAEEAEACCRHKDGYIGEAPGLVAIREMCRMVHDSSYASSPQQVYSGEVDARKKCIISVGGWADWTAIGSQENAVKIAALLAKLVRYTFADGVDLNFDHLGEISRFRAAALGTEGAIDEYGLFAIMVESLRGHLDIVESRRLYDAEVDLFWLNRVYRDSPNSEYYKHNQNHMHSIVMERGEQSDEVVRLLQKKHPRYEPPPPLSISWTARINSFVPGEHPVNYAHAMTAEEKSVALSDWFVEPDTVEDEEDEDEDEQEVEKVVKKPENSPSAATAVFRKIVNWFRPKDKKRRLSAVQDKGAAVKGDTVVSPQDLDDYAFRDVVHDESLEDNEGLKIWPLISAYVDEVVVVAHLTHITDPHPHSEYTSVASAAGHELEEPLDEEKHFIPGNHSAVLNLTAVANNFISIGKVNREKLRILIEPFHLVPGAGNFNPTEFNDDIRRIKRHKLVTYSAWSNDVSVPELDPEHDTSQKRRHQRLLKGSRSARAKHPHGYIAFVHTRGYFSTQFAGQLLAPVFALEWREIRSGHRDKEHRSV